MTERRKFERFALSVPACIEIPSKKGAVKKVAFETENLSAGGIFLKNIKPPVAAGSPVKVEIYLHFDELKREEDPEGTLVITASGAIQRSDENGTAIHLNEDYDILTMIDLIKKKN